MEAIGILDDLFRYSAWANDRIFTLCEGLSDAELDAPREMGFGSLRNTLFHILAAEEIWWERWNGEPFRPFQTDAQGLGLVAIRERLEIVDRKRRALLDRERSSGWTRNCSYQDAKGNTHCFPLHHLVHHVANHGIYHRAQALSFLKGYGRTVVGGLDYLFFRLARPAVGQDPTANAALQQWGLEVASGISPVLAWQPEVISNYFAYNDWANVKVLEHLVSLESAALDRDWGMGLGSIRKTVLHLWDAERWWLRNGMEGSAEYERSPVTTTMEDLRSGWRQTMERRRAFLSSLGSGADVANRLLEPNIKGISLRLPLVEILVQLGGHGTHHRAQLANMLRHSGVKLPGLDYIVWIRERAA